MQEMVYLKQVRLLDSMTVDAILVGWDKKYVYFESRFFVKKQLMGIGMTKFVFTDNRGKICTPTVLDMQGEQLTEVLNTWNSHQTAIKSTPKR